MECKLSCFNHSWIHTSELIDTLWNVNGIIKEASEESKSELIDTLWNVNMLPRYGCTAMYCELIDTLWNVNSLKYDSVLALVKGINRYIMECKSCNRISSRTQSLELIDTLWNVNLNTYSLRVLPHIELIDTLWNVNNSATVGDSLAILN